MEFRSTGKRHLLLMISILLLATGLLVAQSATGRLHGVVSDPSGAVIPGATISLKPKSGATVNAKSDGAGNYDVKGLAPGTYSVSVAAQGFTADTLSVEIAAGQDKKLDFPLQIATKEEKVVVESEGAKVSTNPENNASSVTISGKDLDALSDDPDELQSELQALAGPSAGPNGGQIYIDGFTGGQLPPKSSIREIRINQNPFSAQYDRMGFGRIEILTKPGTDQPHGQFSYNDNHSLFDAMNPFAAAEPDFSSEIFNGNVGGPLGKKASYFLNFERRDIQDAAIIDPEAFAAQSIATGQLVTPVAVLNPRIRMAMNSRIDYQLTSSNTLMARYQYVHNSEQNDGVQQFALPSQAYNQTSYEHSFQLSDTQVLSPRAVNETRFEYERGGTDQNSLTTGPTIQVANTFTEGGNPLGVSSTVSDHYELQNYTSINRGQHFMRFGGRLRETTETINSTKNFNGVFVFAATVDPVTKQQTASALNNFKNGIPSQFTIAKGTPSISDSFVDAGIYAEDDWKIRPNMTLSSGLRFETQNGIGDHGDWAPRLGFAWGLDAKKNAPAKTILRTGFGLFYDRVPQSLIVQTEQLNGHNLQQYTITLNPQGTNQATLSNLYSALPALPNQQTIQGLTTAGTTTYALAPSLRTPYTVQAAASLERQMSRTSTLSVTYLHSQGVHQLFSVNNNSFILGATPAFVYQSEGVFKQNQMIASFNMRAGSKLSIFSYYSLSYANGDTSGSGSVPSDPIRGITVDYGRTAFDVRNRLFFGGTIALPRGFRASPFIVANSGAPFNILAGTDLNGDSIFNDRPSFASSATLPGNLRETPWGNFDIAPGLNDPRVPVNFGTSQAQYTLNLRLSKTFGIGPKLQTTAGDKPQQGGQGGQGGGDRGGPGGGGRGPGGGGDRGSPGGGRGPGGGPGGGMGGIFGGERSNQRYSLTLSVHARNILNHVNPAPPIGDLSSPEFGHSTALASGVFNTQSANRRLDLQVMFAF